VRRAALYAAIVLAFLGTRLWVALGYQPPVSDVTLYARYAWEGMVARAHARSIYAVHDEVNADALQMASMNQYRWPGDDGAIEYPPLAVAALGAPARLLRPPQPLTRETFANFTAKYRTLVRAALFLVDALGLAALLWLLARTRLPLDRAALYVVAGATLCPVLYDRLDLAVGALSALALALLVARADAAWSLAVLALAINLKLVPAVMAPMFIVGAGPRVEWRGIVRRAALLAAMVIAGALPFVVGGGARAFGFLDYHAARG
jgi:hypothetical protein